MSKYSFTFKKDNIFVEFFTEDKDVIERQFQLWVADADSYARSNQPKIVKPINKPEPIATKPDVKKETPAEVKTEAKTEPKAEITEPQKQEKPIVEEKPEENSEVFDKASTLLKTINDIQNPQPEEKVEEKTTNFDEVLEKTIENPTFEPTKVKDKVFLNLINTKNTNDKFHYLMIVAYYLSEFEKMERFSLKQINAKLMQNLSELIDHTMLQEAINQGFIELVPDLTGISEVGEYRLTRLGEDFFAKI